MKIFISWSGDRSKAIAEALYEWLPSVIQPLKPWMSEHDIDKGTRGLPAIAQQLEETQFGVICLTPENLNAPWLLFEAGALSKSQDQSRVWTFLYELEHTDVRGPLAQFQHTRAERNDIKDLLRTVNLAQGNPLISEQQLEIAFNRGWQDLEQRLQTIPRVAEVQPERTEKDMIKEILELARAQVTERRQSSYEADRYMAAFLPLLMNAAMNDPKLADSEIVRTSRELQLNALRRLFSRRLSDAESMFVCDAIFDRDSGSSGFLRFSPEENPKTQANENEASSPTKQAEKIPDKNTARQSTKRPTKS